LFIAFTVIEIGAIVKGAASVSEFCRVEENSVIAASSLVHYMAASSTALTYFFRWGGTCRDFLGVVSYGAMWPDFCLSIAFFVYVSLAVECKNELGIKDYSQICCAFFASFSGVVVIFLHPFQSQLRMLSYLLCFFFMYYSMLLHPSAKVQTFQIAERIEIKEIISTRAQLKKNLTTTLFIICIIPIFVYTLAAFQLISQDLTVVFFGISSGTVKLVYIFILRDLLIHNLTNEERIKLVELNTDIRFLLLSALIRSSKNLSYVPVSFLSLINNILSLSLF
jgi:hypothetical protein